MNRFTLRRHLSLPVAGTPPLTSLNAVAATGLGTTYNTQRAFSNWEVQISTTGGPTFSVQLQGSLDGQNLVNIGSPITTTGLTNVTANTPLTMVALNLTALSGGTLTGTIAGTEAPAGSGGGGGGGAVTQSTGAGAAAPWSVELSDGAAFYTGAKDSTLATTNTEIGGLTETAPGTDIASSGLNGRLQRVAQRLTSLIALLPAALVGGRLDVNIGAAPAAVTLGTGAATVGAVKVTDGTNSAAVKAASTAAIATDPAAVVSLSPNSPLPAGASVIGAVTQSGAWTVQPGNTANTTAWKVDGSTVTQPVSGTVTANQGAQNGAGTASWNVQGAGAQGAAVAGNPVLAGGTDGTNAQFFRIDPGGVKTSLGTTTTGADAVSNNLLLQPARTDGTGAYLGVMPLMSNGVTWDRQRNNVDVTLLASAARTTTQNSGSIVTYNARAVYIVVNVTSAGTGSITMNCNFVDPASGSAITLLNGAAITTNSTNTYKVGIGLTAAANAVGVDYLTRNIQINIVANNANPVTYSVSYMPIAA